MSVHQDDNLILAQMLRDACSLECIPNNVKLPGSIRFQLRDRKVRMDMPEKCVLANMQDNSASFEGWALSFRRWLPHVEKVELAWNSAAKVQNPHYQRFLFRVQQFLLLFPDWFVVSDIDNQKDLTHLLAKPGCNLVVTSPKKDRETASHDLSANMADVITNEHKLECYIKDHPESLTKLLGLQYVDRQFPVGLFQERVKKNNEIFPRGHSAIDLWGVTGNQMVLFELKAEGNTRVGILSELFFYSYIMEGVQAGRYALQYANEWIAGTKAVRSYILGPQTHPLIDSSVLKMANDAFDAAERKIKFGIIQIDAKSESFSIKMPAV